MGSRGVRAGAAAAVAMCLAGSVIGALALAGPSLPSAPAHKHFVPAVAGIPDTTSSPAPAPGVQVTAPPAAATGDTTSSTSSTTTTTQPQPAIGGPAHAVCTDPSGFCYGP